MTDDTPIFDVIVGALWHSDEGNASLGGCHPLAKDVLAALRDAGYEVIPADTAKLGQAVERLHADGDTFIRRVYAEAGVERP